MTTQDTNHQSKITLTPEQQCVCLLARRLFALVCDLLVPLILGALLGLPFSFDAEAQSVDHGPTPSAADDTIPTEVENPEDELGRPIPVCKQCGATAKKVTASDGSVSGVCVEFTFGSGDGTPYNGEIEIEMRWEDGTTLVVYEEEVAIGDGGMKPTEIDGEGLGFDHVVHVTYRLLTPPPQQ